ncbi:uncharacterized protein [Montipora foliosa]|uniref:uncharacterized protein n=1 Tax=Montipora foliosa TaxID=591990 RepID=UPI0035F1734F
MEALKRQLGKCIHLLAAMVLIQEQMANLFGAAICSPPCLLFSNTTNIIALDYKTSAKHSIVNGLTRAVAIDFHYSLGYIFWSDVLEQNIKRSKVDGSNIVTIITGGVCDGLAVEWRKSELYWTDTTHDTISVSDLSGNNQRALVSSGLKQPRDIALDPDRGLMIWTDWGTSPKIEKATLNGNQRTAIVTSYLHWPNGIELDRGNQRVFWVDAAYGRLESVTYHGNNRTLHTSIRGFHAFGLSMIAPLLFLTDWTSKGPIHTIDATTGNYVISNYVTSGRPMGIVAYDSSRQPPVSNQCSVNNGGCSHFCVVTSSGHVCVCPVGFTVKHDGRTCENKLKKFFLFTDANDKSINVISLDVSDLMAKKLFKHQRPIALDFDPIGDRVYWTDVEGGFIMSAFLNATSVKELFRCNVKMPDGLAIDKVGRNIYWSDTGTNRIEVAKLDGTKRKLLIKDGLDEPRAIVLDERNGIMYWTDWGSIPKIEQAAMDGSSRRTIVTGNLGWPNGLTIDRSKNLLYWADAKLDKIESSDLNGGHRKSILSSTTDMHPFGLTMFQNFLYWTDWISKSVSRLDLNNRKREMIITGLNRPMDIHLYDSSVTITGSHPCASNNGLCSDLCLLKPHGGYQCACPTGVALKSDGKTCDYDQFNKKSTEEFMLFPDAASGKIFKVSLAVTDTPCELLAIENNITRPVAIDYDPVDGKVYWTDVSMQQVTRAYPNGSDIEVIAKSNVVNPDGIAIDWIGRNLYWTDEGTNRIEVSRLDGSFRRSLITSNLPRPRAVTLDIETRQMFWSDWGYLPKIEKANMDGTARVTLVSSGLSWVNSLALDLKNKLLYWCDARLDKIERVNFMGNNRALVLRLSWSKRYHPFGLALYGDVLFWSDWGTKSVHRFNLTSSISKEVIQGLGRPMEIHIHDVKNIAAIGPTSCSNFNGGCSHLCLPNPTGHRCFCPEGVQLKYNDPFVCQGASRCTQLSAPSHGRLGHCSNVPGQICQISCNAGYQLHGSSVRTCNYDGTWSGLQTSCSTFFCPPLVTPARASLLSAACNNSYGSSCSFSCQTGYTSSTGNTTRTCLSSGQWSGSDINCTDSQPPTFGVSCPGSPLVAYAEQGKFTALVNWTDPVAIDNSGVVPTVTSNYQSPQRFSQGVHVIKYRAEDQSGNEARCSFEVSVTVINCSSMMVDPTGPLRMSRCGNHYGSKCNFSCEIGHRLIGSSVVTCVASGNRPPAFWDSKLPVCEIIFCPQLVIPSRASLLSAACNNSYASNCSFSCQTGYTSSTGNITRTCLSSGQWSGSDINCTDSEPPTFGVSCPGSPLVAYAEQGKFTALVNWTDPVAIDNSGVAPTVTSNYQSPQRFSQGVHVIKYRAMDQSGNEARCSFQVSVTVINCTSMMVDPTGPLRTSSCGNHYGSKCNFSCEIGHRLIGSSVVTCLAPGDRPPAFWNSKVPVCEVIFCPPLVTPTRASLLSAACNNSYGSNCSFSCQTGYTSSTGNITRTCLSSGQWSGSDINCTDSQPPTFGVSCPERPLVAYAEQGKFTALVNWTDPVAIDNSGVAPTVTSNYQSPQRFSQGVYVIKYRAMDKSGNEARCSFQVTVTVINCTSIMVDPTGPLRMSSCGNHYGSKCNFSCEIGHRLIGSSVVTCLAPGDRPPAFWDSKVPVCEIIFCPPLVTPTRASLLSAACNNSYGSNCSFSCQTGYTSSTGNITRTCLSSGQWSGSDINCTDSQPPTFGVSCPGSPLVAYAEQGKFTALVNWTEPVAIDNSGVAPTVTSNYQSPQRFSQGVHLIKYRAMDQSGNEARCSFQVSVTVINCTSMTVDPTGPLRMSSCGNHYGSNCNFSCEIGHRLIGSSVVTCLAPGDRPPAFWDSKVPVCEVIFCPPLVTPARTSLLSAACNNSYGSNCSFSCQTGYTSPTGNITRTCLSSGQWSGSDINCTDSQPPTFGVSCPGSPLVAYAEQGKFTALVNWTEPVAIDNSGVAPTVTSNYQSPQRFSQGVHLIKYRAMDQSGNEARCSFQVSVTVINCTSMMVDPTGPLRMSSCGNHYGSNCNFSCEIGHRLIGSSVVTCLAPGDRPPAFWDSKVPVCEVIFCPPLVTPARTSLLSAACNNSYGSNCSFSCQTGFTSPTGNITRTCLSSGQWSGSDINCTDSQPPTFGVSCPGSPLVAYAEQGKFTALVNWTEPVAIDNSGVAPTVTSNYQSPQRFSQGVHLIKYRAMDQSGNEARCSFQVSVTVINCTSMMVDPTGPLRMSSCGNHYGSNCNFSCEIGHRLIGSSVVTCLAPGDRPPAFWDSKVPVCEVIFCPPLVTPTRASLLSAACNNSYGSNCSFSCQTGYTSSTGNITRTCLSSGQWSGSDINCTDSQLPTFGVSCPGSPLVAYAEQGKFTALVNWTEPVAIDNSGVAPTVTSNYQSPQRFNQGVHLIKYRAMDQSGNEARCSFQVSVTVINCTSMMVDPTGPLRMSSCGNHYGSNCNFSCEIGHRLIGSSVVTCLAPGDRPPAFWDSKVPVCEVIFCPPLVTPARTSLLSAACNNSYGSNCSFSCQTGFTSPTGNITRTCLSSGQWSGSDINCTDSQPPTFGVSCPGSPLVAYAEQGKFTALVNWTEPVATDNSGVAPTVTSNYQSPQRFSQGVHLIKYRAMDHLGNEARCSFQVSVTVINCTSMMVDPTGPLRMSSCGNHYGSNCNFSCEIGHRLIGSSVVTCLAPGDRPPAFWDSKVPVCEVIFCPPLVTPTRASLLSASCNNSYGSNCSFSCQTGYTSSTGNITRTCLSSGQWSGSDITCTDSQPPTFGVSCPGSPLVAYADRGKFTALVNWTDPVAIDNSGAAPTVTSNYQSPQSFSQGIYVIKYTAVDQSGNEARCSFKVNVTVIKCISMMVNPSGPLRMSRCGNHFGSKCDFSCEIGYRLIGSSAVTCLARDKRPPGVWDNPVPVCQDSQPPTFGGSCPGSTLVAYAERGKFTALVNWTDPVAVDNSGVAPIVTSNYHSPQRFSQGSHVINYTALDQSGNKATCFFTVNVSVISCPLLTVNPDGPLHISSCGNYYGSKCSFSCATGYHMNGSSTVTCSAPGERPPGVWDTPPPACQDLEPPQIHTCPQNNTIVSNQPTHILLLPGVKVTDNVGVDRFSTSIPNATEATWGEYNIVYTAEDKAGNKAFCRFQITIFESPCGNLAISPPKNGAKACEVGIVGGVICTVHCNKGYYFATQPSETYVFICSSAEKWIRSHPKAVNGRHDLPDCSKRSNASIAMWGQAHYLTSSCDHTPDMLEEIRMNFIRLFYGTTFGIRVCGTDPLCRGKFKVQVKCSEQSRRKRETVAKFPLTIDFEIRVSLSYYNKTSVDFNQTFKETSRDILSSLKNGDWSLNVSGVVIETDTSRPPEVRFLRLVCNKGQVLRGTSCVNCPVGYYFNNASCQACAEDQYQDKEAQTSCISCPAGTSTSGRKGSKQKQSCQELSIFTAAKPREGGISKKKLILIISGVLAVVLIAGIYAARKCFRVQRHKKKKENPPTGFFNQAYEFHNNDDFLDFGFRDGENSSEA